MRISDHVAVATEALVSWGFLSGLRQGELLEVLEALSAQPPEQWPSETVPRVPADEPRYALRAADGLWVFFTREDDGQLTIRDMVLQETIDRYFSDRHQPSPSA